MSFRVGDDGEIEFLDDIDTYKGKRKRRSTGRRIAQGCGRLVVLIIFFTLGAVGGFALQYVLKPSSPIIAAAPSTCLGYIKTMSVAGASALLPGNDRPNTKYTLIGLDGHSFTTIDMHGNVDSFDLSRDEQHVVESRYETVAPYFLIYTWNIDKFGRRDERIVTYGKYPSWSPDGKQIAFFRSYSSDRSALYLINADGSNSRMLRLAGALGSAASWSPDGAQLVFSTTEIGENTPNITVYNIEDGSERSLVKNGLAATYPQWSPDGKRIAYVSHDIYTIDVDGTDRRNITDGKFSSITNIGWSSSSQTIAFLGTAPNTHNAIYAMDPDGSGLHKVYDPCPS